MNIDSARPALEDKLKQIASAPKRFMNRLTTVWQRLTLPQRLYLLAALLLMSEHLGLVAIITTIALTLEFWPLFERVWHSLAGKAILLLFYAIVANYALAMAGAIVNEVVGVPANHFNYTHNFAILLLLPAWILGISAVGLLFVQLLMPFYLMIALILKPIGIKLFSLTGNNHYRFTTLMVRFVLSFVLLYHLILLIGDVEQRVESALSDIKTMEQSLKKDSNQNQKMRPTIETDGAVANGDVGYQPGANAGGIEKEASLLDQDFIQVQPDDQTDNQQDRELALEYASLRQTYHDVIRVLIAQFAYYYEADSRSRCEKHEDANVVELNDYEILEVVPDNAAKYRYRFTVRKCISPAFPDK
ncbi:hypothetical protein GNT65_01650 [Shewanella sp. JBTF-M18]|uniref:Uncharacterized protein n=1 Tax=Shewanella insulae TaxID=2681496 RepID=A0A6L7HSX9_9GAMM|nr:hypothetical protein [Shewanella insulae]MXR67389.1 hypothetical protein [Shewanella insulae]